VTRFRDFARRDHFEPRRADLREICRSVALMTELDLKARRIPFRLEVPPAPIWAEVDTLQIQQALLNLVNNARDAVQLSPHEAARSENPIILRAGELSGFRRLEVVNGGPGISLAAQGQLFQRYFTTKPQGMGTGLGLDVSRRIVEQHGGRVLFCSDDGETRFVIDLPGDLPRSQTGLRRESAPAPDVLAAALPE
jgi:two-component system, NtrC family, sensor kinase